MPSLISCCVMLCFVVLYCVLLCCVGLRYALLCYAFLCCVVLCCVLLRLLRRVVYLLCRVAFCCVVPCSMWCCVVLYELAIRLRARDFYAVRVDEGDVLLKSETKKIFSVLFKNSTNCLRNEQGKNYPGIDSE